MTRMFVEPQSNTMTHSFELMPLLNIFAATILVATT